LENAGKKKTHKNWSKVFHLWMRLVNSKGRVGQGFSLTGQTHKRELGEKGGTYGYNRTRGAVS